jgi:hypothetical protein
MKRWVTIILFVTSCADLKRGENLDVEINVTINDLYDWYQKCVSVPESKFDEESLRFFRQIKGTPPMKNWDRK